MRRLVLVANPAASKFTGSLHRDVVEILSASFDVTPVWPNGPEEARLIAARAAGDGVDVVAAMGGDGVAHRVANGLRGSDTALGIVPAGTTNVLARVLGLPRNPRRAAQRLGEDPVRLLPTMALESAASESDAADLVLFSAGAGFDADIVARAEEDPIRKVGFGPLHYARTVAKVMVSEYAGRLPTLRVEADGRQADAVGVFVQLHDRYTEVGPVPLRLTSEVGSGLTALVATKVDIRVGVRVLTRAVTRRDPQRIPGVEVWTGLSRLTVTADPPARHQADGELLGQTSWMAVTRSQQRLLVAGGTPQR
jgi:diacylglycerol kinase family enzyme